ncbi:MAG: GNAT family N-acetyltransferase [Caldisericaceae bacterium]
MTFTDDTSQIKPENLGGFFAGWKNPPSKEKLLELLKNSFCVVLAVDDKTGNVVGSINALSDKLLFACIPLLEVLPDWQGRGIGSTLLNLMLEKLKAYYAVDLCCEKELVPFYERFDFSSVAGLIKRNSENIK